ncbi:MULTISPECIES: hypothetical protein [unclassified Streptomyces]|uniref:hypothetical protein n=1 Tax=unclassified Streptomyces TaxID=2593676 RepID=UPI000DC7DD91|nr:MULTISPECIES: hypothetical protein [unclassified Streptomyces]AWZ07042.1 hypothetical protein DRB89_23170 [Streptomyces sp. ICC4]AWZ14678.1 hypothetical protein DRB96_23160 [Streptomyces sp. ICC1]
MRMKSLLASSAAVAALLTLTACDDGGGTGNPSLGGIGAPNGSNGSASSKGTGFKGLPKAGNMAGAARIVGMYTDCKQVRPLLDSYNGSKADPDAEYDKSYSVTERGYCDSRGRTSIFMIKDAKAFQTAYKAEVDKEKGSGNRDTGPVIGQDFATGSEDADVMIAMVAPHTGLMVLNCHADFSPPSGYRKEPALVKGCVLTDYFKD